MRDALEKAADEIAALCGCSEWEYPGQLVRDVQHLKDRADRTEFLLRGLLSVIYPGQARVDMEDAVDEAIRIVVDRTNLLSYMLADLETQTGTEGTPNDVRNAGPEWDTYILKGLGVSEDMIFGDTRYATVNLSLPKPEDIWMGEQHISIEEDRE
jgi:hypothetical protein